MPFQPFQSVGFIISFISLLYNFLFVLQVERLVSRKFEPHQRLALVRWARYV